MSMSFIQQGLPVLVLVLLAMVVGLGVGLIRTNTQLRRVRDQWSELLSGADGSTLEAMVRDQLRLSRETREDLQKVTERVGTLEGKMKSAKRFVGLVRFNAFDDVGGDQSFSLACYDEEGNGCVLSSQVGRQTSRVFGKLLNGGKSDYNLAAEEQLAIEQAVQGRARPRVGP